jgi:lycopene cyclase domain-containing protein
VIAGPATLLFIAKDKVTLNLRAFALAFLYVCMPFIVWDMWAASNEHWGFNPRYIIGPYIFKLPIEEMLFFVTVPFAMTFVWELMASRVKDINNPKIIQCILWVVVIVSGMAAGYFDGAYTKSVLLALSFCSLLLLRSKIYVLARFWRFQLYHLGVFVVFNGVLTALPIITYSGSAIIGIRLGTIPLEDFAYSFCLISLFVLAYNKQSKSVQAQ